MNESRVYVHQLQKLHPQAWTELLNEAPDLGDIEVYDVVVEPVADHPRLTRYLLSLLGYSDPIPFIGKRTNLVEAQFYAEIAPYLPDLAPRCWLSHIASRQSWVILDDVPHHRPESCWTSDETEKMVMALASLHTIFWEQTDFLAEQTWLENRLARSAGGERRRGYYDLVRDNSYFVGLGQSARLSAHALQTAGQLAQVLGRSAAGLTLLQRLGGWQDVIHQTHLDALAELLDDPLPMLQSLRELPVTLLHGQIAPRHWRVTLFNERYLVDWSRLSFGPSICDLVSFQEHMARLWAQTERPVSEETITDSYFLRMSMQLGAEFPGRQIRQALPAALCLYVLVDWLPRFAQWCQPFIHNSEEWHRIAEMDDRQLKQAGWRRFVGLRPYLTDLFYRFRLAYNQI